ncbi:FecR family protein [Stenotrophobium rhamnosiphilum]|uniref:Iron dicitrate transport regulator FecR n=1 Tax=Stenotrophobium rhamnosiphilum TaxID=2029166 RepID=A0A2T5MBA5_9GAMM|nr:FecR domain-containing protein [Stenotrophobium rhamnosiphilum]PTU28274.1 iron dicitrate transport regulator FecR [Stenotrophobium rhamnosiphilum]
MSNATRIEESAVAWCVKRERADWSASDQAELDAWLSESTAHRVAMLRMEYGWQRVDRMAALRSSSLSQVAPVHSPYQPDSKKRWLAMAAGFLLVMSLSIFGAQQWMGNGTQRYVTMVGGHETVPLKDGSNVELNTNTHLRAVVDEKARVVWLDKGEAYFEVAHDEKRPFVVYAGDRRIVVLGTHFLVRRDHDRIEVMVAEGRVRVEGVDTTKPLKSAIITPGNMVVSESGSMMVAMASPEKVESELAWRRGYLVFDRTSLASVAEQFNRYNEKKILIEDPKIIDTRISGSFEANNVDAFGRLLQRAYGLSVVDHKGQLWIAQQE